MIPISVPMARLLISLLAAPVRYEHGNTRCPLCHSVALVTSTGDRIQLIQVRYHECGGCCATFKSTEKIELSGNSPEKETPTPVKVMNKRGRPKKLKGGK